ncbi:MAG: hypothetical protein R2878_12815 [Thermoleophilia bacterium]
MTERPTAAISDRGVPGGRRLLVLGGAIVVVAVAVRLLADSRWAALGVVGALTVAAGLLLALRVVVLPDDARRTQVRGLVVFLGLMCLPLGMLLGGAVGGELGSNPWFLGLVPLAGGTCLGVLLLRRVDRLP